MCDEIIGYVKRLVRGFDLDDAHIGLDVIAQVGPGGEFLTTDQTMDLFRTEHWLPDQCNRDNLDNWVAKGSKTWAEKSVEKALRILRTHAPAPLSQDAAKALADLREEAAVKLEGHHFEA